jgi:hypothetical protein
MGTERFALRSYPDSFAITPPHSIHLLLSAIRIPQSAFRNPHFTAFRSSARAVCQLVEPFAMTLQRFHLLSLYNQEIWNQQ